MGVIHSQFRTLADDLGLGQVLQRGADFELPALVAGFGAEAGGFGEGANELRAAVRVAGVVQRVNADEDVARVFGLRRRRRRRRGTSDLRAGT